ncbi:MAG: hypothetical protein P8Y23_16485 [Candidatus Lokiarchaeota archaeon]
MIIKIKINKNKKALKNTLEVRVQRKKELDQEMTQIYHFFENRIMCKKIRRIHPYYKITSQNPAIMLSLISSLQELIPDIYFSSNDIIDLNGLKDT